MIALLSIIIACPLIVFTAISLSTGKSRVGGPLLSIAGAFTALAANFALIYVYASQSAHHPETLLFERAWLTAHHPIRVGFLLDPLNLVMLTLVTSIHFLVQVFSIAYMNDEKDKPRYFAFLSFFAFTMIGLVLSSNLLQTFMFWELVGAASYLLIGFWFEKPAAVQAARKAFVMNRLADLGFILGIILLLLNLDSINIMAFTPENIANLSAPMITLCGILILTGVMGKSAQFPFHNWLPDAMEGPTPVSALIHSATMVAAGVFLLARIFPLFAASSTTLLVILIIGTITALLSAILATSQSDIKKVLAYSTISQLGLMVMAIGSASVAFGMFHLVTHAFFKSMLFLTAGALIHHYGTNNLSEMAKRGAGRNVFLMLILFIGLASLCGIPPFAGFFSKDAILHHLSEHHRLFAIFGWIITFFTAWYSARMLTILLVTKPQEHTNHGHKSPSYLRVFENFPLMTLAVTSIVAGFMGTPLLGSMLLHWLDKSAHMPAFNFILFAVTSSVIIVGAVIGWLQASKAIYAHDIRKNSPGWFAILRDNKFYVDAAYDVIVHRVTLPVAKLLTTFDRLIPNKLMVDRSALGVRWIGKVFSQIQNGILQNYLLIAMLLLFFVIYYLSGVRTS